MQIKLDTKHFVMLSIGSMIGSGWLFSPFYGYEVAGVGVLLAWVLTGALIGVIGLSFARVCATLPLVGGVYRMLTITHDHDLARIFLLVGWFSYLLHLPLEAQTAVQYLGFWWTSLVHASGTQYELSGIGAVVAASIMVLLTWLNTLALNKVSSINVVVSLWKIAVPILLMVLVIAGHGSWSHVLQHAHERPFSLEHVLLAISGCGLAFAFDGFQNGLVLAQHATRPRRAVALSLFLPVLLCVLLYGTLSLGFIATSAGPLRADAVAPLLGLLAALGMAQGLSTLLFVDAMLSPLGTAHVYTTVSARILYSIGLEWPRSKRLRQIDAHGTPQFALWVNCALSVLMLLAFPTWTELVSLLTSALVLAYLAGPVSLLALHARDQGLGLEPRPTTAMLGYAAFVCCSGLVYWSGLASLRLVTLALLLAIGITCLARRQSWRRMLRNTWMLPAYLASLWLLAWLRAQEILHFPSDNLLVVAVGLVFCRIYLAHRQSDAHITRRLEAARQELSAAEESRPPQTSPVGAR